MSHVIGRGRYIRETYPQRGASGAPTPATGGLFVQSFTFLTASPLVLTAIVAGQSIGRTGIVITTTFDGGGASLRLGTPFSPALFLAASDSLPAQMGQYENSAVLLFTVADTLQLAISPGAGATQGGGLVFFEIT